MTLFIISFVAGILTILAPCVLPLLPVILGGAVAEVKNRRRPFIIIGSLSISVLVFTLLLKGSTALITVSPSLWSYISAGIFLAFGLTLVFPDTWARLVLKIPGHNKPDRWISRGYTHGESFWTDVIVGAALGPVFTTCSPTFFVILATVLPQSFAMGVVDLLAYIVGLALSLLLISFIGQRLVNRLEWLSDPKGWFKLTLGFLFIILAGAVAFGWDKKIEADILQSGFFDVTSVEQRLHQYLDGAPSIYPATADKNSVLYTDIVRPSGFVNSEPFTFSSLIGKKVILVDFIDYTCINCERTFPYLNDWYAKYKDQGLEVVAIHTPEFSFEKDIKNVTAAAKQFGLMFPIVLDNDYATWNAYGNQYWPHKYLIDITGHVVYDHIGEGGYAETESEIIKALNQRMKFLGQSGSVTMGTTTISDTAIQTQSPETYFGAARNELFGNGYQGFVYQNKFTIPNTLNPNTFYLGGSWDIQREYIKNSSADAQLSFVFKASKMYIVASPSFTSAGAAMPVKAKVFIDGKPITQAQSGSDVKNGIVTIDSSRLYNLFSDTMAGAHRIDIIFTSAGVEAFTFTFG
ncbi:MAG TPA: cytochrome c biogenesis protein CcdA [Candidatus Paceibacterota bacterium]|jgi:cytochrome c biogenesis protein CcdA/thiol-disulfide isomerase/thioredoxin|nr:cytochrome c biogenesis protein CcdA [Candidatus Paceibacterota bacterium]